MTTNLLSVIEQLVLNAEILLANIRRDAPQLSGRAMGRAITAGRAALAVVEVEDNTLGEIIGCFDAAIAEGLYEAIAETTDERLKDLLARRVMHAYYKAIGPTRHQATEPAPSTAGDARLAEYPEKCPITRRDFFMVIEHPKLGMVPTYGGPYDSYTIPVMEGEPDQPFQERELRCERYDHDFGGWVEDEGIPLRVISESALEELQAAALLSAPAMPVVELTDEQRKAAAICLSANKVSVSMIQRTLNIGYNAAQELCQSIIDAGLVPGVTISPSLQTAAAHTQPERVPLTPAEITSMAYDLNALPEVVTDATLVDLVRAVEEYHGITNKATKE